MDEDTSRTIPDGVHVEPGHICHMCPGPASFRHKLGDLWCWGCWDSVQAPKEGEEEPEQAGAAKTLRERLGLSAEFLAEMDAVAAGLHKEPPPVKERMDKLPPRALLWVGRTLAEGMKYEDEEAGTNHWETRPPSYHFNRMMRHAMLYLSGDRTEDHAGHVMTRALMWGDRLDAEAGMVNTLDGRLATPVDITGTWADSSAPGPEEGE